MVPVLIDWLHLVLDSNQCMYVHISCHDPSTLQIPYMYPTNMTIYVCMYVCMYVCKYVCVYMYRWMGKRTMRTYEVLESYYDDQMIWMYACTCSHSKAQGDSYYNHYL